MKNSLNKMSFYKKTSVMLIETSVGVNYGEANPFVHFKFAPRADHNAQGQWDDQNCFWITSYIDLFNFVNGINLVSNQKIEKYELKNPKKGASVQIRRSVNSSTNVEYMVFYFYRGQDVKINVSLTKATEYTALFNYFKNLLDNYNTVCATALLRNDVYYEFFLKGKEKGQQNQGQKNAQKFNQGGGPDRFNNQQNAGQQPNQQQPNQQQPNQQQPNQQQPNQQPAGSIEDEINNMNSGMSFGGEDVPF